jgi:protoporphyrinogen oxidase
VDRAKREFHATGLLGDAQILDGAVVRVPKSYPVYARGYQNHLDVVIGFLRQFEGLTPIGRYGAFKYNNQDHSILMGLLAAERILSHGQHDLWSVNTDYESYQEEAMITASGLVAAEASH